MEDDAALDNRISNFEWGFVGGVAVAIDLLQMAVEALDLTLIGIAFSLIVNRMIDLITGLMLFSYCFLRGIKLTPTRTMSILGATLAEFIPALDVAPFWTADVGFLFASYKAEHGSGMISQFVSTTTALAEGKVGDALAGGGRKVPPVIGTRTPAPTTPARIADIKPTVTVVSPLPPKIAPAQNALPARQAAPRARPEPTGAIEMTKAQPLQTRDVYATSAGQYRPDAATSAGPSPAAARSGPEMIGRTFQHDQEIAQGQAAEAHRGGVRTYDEWVASRQPPRSG